MHSYKLLAFILFCRKIATKTFYRESIAKIAFLPQNSTYYCKITAKFAILSFHGTVKFGKIYLDKYGP